MTEVLVDPSHQHVTSVVCAALAVDLVWNIVDEALASGVFGDNAPSAPSSLSFLAEKSVTLPDTARSGKERIEAASHALEIAIAVSLSPECADFILCQHGRHSLRIQPALKELAGLLRQTRDNVHTLHETLHGTEVTSSRWWQGMVDNALSSASTVALVAGVVQSAADCLRVASSVVREAQEVLKGATDTLVFEFSTQTPAVPDALTLQDHVDADQNSIYHACEAARAAKTQAAATVQLAANMAVETNTKRQMRFFYPFSF